MAGKTNNTPITDAELAEVKRLVAAATPGDWRMFYGGEPLGLGANGEPVGWMENLRDAEAVIALHNAFPGVLARLEAAEREREELASIVKSPEYRQMLADQANLPARDAQQRREGAAEAWDIVAERSKLVGDTAGEMYATGQAKRLREGGE